MPRRSARPVPQRLAALVSAAVLLLMGGPLTTQASAASTGAAADEHPQICYRAYVESVGWEADEWCNGIGAGLPGFSVQALQLSAANVGTLCARANLAVSGWQAWQCSSTEWGRIQIGSTTAGRGVRAVELSVTTGVITAEVEMSNSGYQGPRTGSTVLVGSPGGVDEIEFIGIAVR